MFKDHKQINGGRGAVERHKNACLEFFTVVMVTRLNMIAKIHQPGQFKGKSLFYINCNSIKNTLKKRQTLNKSKVVPQGSLMKQRQKSDGN